jgi:hypothetical protein
VTRHGTFLAVVVLSLAACAGSPVLVPPDSAAPEVVLTTYLQALVRGDCSVGKALGTTSFGRGNGNLCGETTVSSFRIDGPPAEPNATEVVFATTLVTTGTADHSVAPGSLTWFFDLQRQPGGAWRLAGGGSGP